MNACLLPKPIEPLDSTDQTQFHSVATSCIQIQAVAYSFKQLQAVPRKNSVQVKLVNCVAFIMISTKFDFILAGYFSSSRHHTFGTYFGTIFKDLIVKNATGSISLFD